MTLEHTTDVGILFNEPNFEDAIVGLLQANGFFVAKMRTGNFHSDARHGTTHQTEWHISGNRQSVDKKDCTHRVGVMRVVDLKTNRLSWKETQAYPACVDCRQTVILKEGWQRKAEERSLKDRALSNLETLIEMQDAKTFEGFHLSPKKSLTPDEVADIRTAGVDPAEIQMAGEQPRAGQTVLDRFEADPELLAQALKMSDDAPETPSHLNVPLRFLAAHWADAVHTSTNPEKLLETKQGLLREVHRILTIPTDQLPDGEAMHRMIYRGEGEETLYIPDEVTCLRKSKEIYEKKLQQVADALHEANRAKESLRKIFEAYDEGEVIGDRGIITVIEAERNRDWEAEEAARAAEVSAKFEREFALLDEMGTAAEKGPEALEAFLKEHPEMRPEGEES
jgi:hypothetical protein